MSGTQPSLSSVVLQHFSLKLGKAKVHSFIQQMLIKNLLCAKPWCSNSEQSRWESLSPWRLQEAREIDKLYGQCQPEDELALVSCKLDPSFWRKENSDSVRVLPTCEAIIVFSNEEEGIADGGTHMFERIEERSKFFLWLYLVEGSLATCKSLLGNVGLWIE